MGTFICRECGKELGAEDRFCNVCGLPFEPMERATREGIEAFEEGEYEKALQAFKGEARKKPSSPFALRDAGHSAFHLQDAVMALEYYEKALKLEPRLLDVHFNVGLIRLKQGQVNDAMASFTQTLRLLHSLVPGSFYLGLFHTRESLDLQCRLNLGALLKQRGEV